MIAQDRIDAHARPVAAPRNLLRFVPSLYAIGVFAVLAAVFMVAMEPRADTDFWWHLKVGQYIWVHHVVPSRDYMSYTFVGRPWTDHEWLAELTLYGVYSLGGLWALTALFAGIILATWTLVYLRMVRLGVNRVLSLFVLVGAFFSSTASWGVRIQMVSLLFVAAYALLLDSYRRTRSRRLLAAFPLLMLLWTNLHGGFVLGLVVMGLTLAGEALNTLTHKEGALDGDDLKALGIALAATVAVTILNPNGYRQLLYPLTFVLPNAFTNQIQESASPNFHMPVMMVWELLLLALVVVVYLTRPAMNWTQLFLILAFTHLAFSQVRNVPLWCVLVAPYLALYAQRGRAPRKRGQLSARFVPFVNLGILVALVLVYATMVHKFITPRAMADSQRSSFPIGAVAYMTHHTLPPHVFVSYAWGGYLLWNLYPRYRDFMDSRADTLYNSHILNAYLDAYSGSPDWRSVLRTYHVQDVLIEPDAPLSQLLALSPGWKRVYRDSGAVLYTLRRGPGHKRG